MSIDPSRPAGDRPPVIFEDDHVVAVVKPAGIPTANAARGARSLFTILQRSRPPGGFLGVVSRLDAPVSGVLLLAVTREAAADLSRQFRERLVEKTYFALVEGRFPAPLGEWVDWSDRLSREGQERRTRVLALEGDEAPAADGQSHLRGRVRLRRGEISLVELVPSTGRRHQLRAQLAARGCPIVGDRTYGARLPFPSAPGLGAAIALHARRLGVAHPASGRPLEFEADWPTAWIARLPDLDRRLGGGV